MTDLQRAINNLRAVRYCCGGRYAYYAPEIQSAVLVHSDELREYGALLRHGQPDAYSQWRTVTAKTHILTRDRERAIYRRLGM